MNDTTMKSLERLTRLHDQVSIKHSNKENQSAYDRGVEAARNGIGEGDPVHLQDEAGVFMSDLQIS